MARRTPMKAGHKRYAIRVYRDKGTLTDTIKSDVKKILKEFGVTYRHNVREYLTNFGFVVKELPQDNYYGEHLEVDGNILKRALFKTNEGGIFIIETDEDIEDLKNELMLTSTFGCEIAEIKSSLVDIKSPDIKDLLKALNSWYYSYNSKYRRIGGYSSKIQEDFDRCDFDSIIFSHFLKQCHNVYGSYTDHESTKTLVQRCFLYKLMEIHGIE